MWLLVFILLGLNPTGAQAASERGLRTSFVFKPMKSGEIAQNCSKIKEYEFAQDSQYKIDNQGKTNQYVKDAIHFIQQKQSLKSVNLKNVRIQFRASCNTKYDSKKTLDFSASCERDPGDQAPCIQYTYQIPDKNQAQLQKNVIYHEIGHLVLYHLTGSLRLQPNTGVHEAFADFFAYSISKDPFIGLYFNEKNHRPEYIRKMLTTNISNNIKGGQDWGFSQLSRDKYAAGEKLRDALIFVSERHGFDEAVSALVNILRRTGELQRSLPLEDEYQAHIDSLEKACTEHFAKYF
ncbi:hypothetical protein [Bdellovibrio sp. HCB2-146]|uniref:hypothetical protein n=1 Tax=Bdellovibrio sp. HCB2-146 TaxID=3394362 RepID=UPI0039BC5CC6